MWEFGNVSGIAGIRVVGTGRNVSGSEELRAQGQEGATFKYAGRQGSKSFPVLQHNVYSPHIHSPNIQQASVFMVPPSYSFLLEWDCIDRQLSQCTYVWFMLFVERSKESSIALLTHRSVCTGVLETLWFLA